MRRLILALSIAGFLNGCAGLEKPEEAPLVLKPASFGDLAGWRNDDLDGVLSALRKSCERIVKRDPKTQFGSNPVFGTYEDWQGPCKGLLSVDQVDARRYFETWFVPWRASMGGVQDEGLFTGYYEPLLHGSLKRHGAYQYPLRLRPADLVMVDLGLFRDDLKGRRIAGRVKNGQLKPFENRSEISKGKLSLKKAPALVWVNSKVDAFFLHIQGSGQVKLDDGTILRVGYAGQNGHPYYAIGRELINRGVIKKEDVSLQSIRHWLETNPEQADDVMDLNKSYVFFQKLEGDGPLGGEGVSLTPERSLAVDRSKIAYGVPIWVEADAPAQGEDDIKRLMVAQDTGGAIRGGVRGDVFWGYGERAAFLAGQMKSPGRMWLLLPRNVMPNS